MDKPTIDTTSANIAEDALENSKRHPIKVVVERTGLTAFVIRAWENRYAAVEPGRTNTNRRLYSDRDIDKLRLLRIVTSGGQSIGRVAGMEVEELIDLTQGMNLPIPIRSKAGRVGRVDHHQGKLEEMIGAVCAMDSRGFEKLLANASADLSQPELLEHVIIPLLVRLGEMWQSGHARIVHEHVASATIRTFLGNMIYAANINTNAPAIVLSTPSGQLHEFGALLAGVTAMAVGWQIIYLGPNLPAEEIANAARHENVRAVGLSIVYPPDDPRLPFELRQLRRIVGDDMDVLIGGRAATHLGMLLNELQFELVGSLGELRESLIRIRGDRMLV